MRPEAALVYARSAAHVTGFGAPDGGRRAEHPGGAFGGDDTQRRRARWDLHHHNAERRNDVGHMPSDEQSRRHHPGDGADNGPPVLLGVLETETHVTFGKMSSDASGQTLRSDTLRCVTSRAVRGSSGSPIGTLQYTLQSTTENVRKAPFNVQLRSPEGHVLLQYQLPPYDTWCESPALLNVWCPRAVWCMRAAPSNPPETADISGSSRSARDPRRRLGRHARRADRARLR